MDEIKMWAIDGTKATPVSAKSMTDSEWQLEEILVNNPDMLIPGLTLVGRQTNAAGGRLDLLGVDDDGNLVLFELKRGRLSREAVAQIIDYASALEAKGADELAKHIAQHSASVGMENFKEWYAEKSGTDDLDSLLPLRMFLVGLGVDNKTELMVNFLAEKGVDISLLTFQGFEQDGKTTLARLTQVMADDDSVSSKSQTQKRVSGAEWLEQLTKRAEEGGIVHLFTDVREMFRREFERPNESPNSLGITMYVPMRVSGKRTVPAFARVDPEHGQVRIVFIDRSVEQCTEDFRPLLDGEIRYETWPRDRKNTPLNAPQPQIQFLVNAEEWDVHKDKLRALTQAVYAAARQRADS